MLLRPLFLATLSVGLAAAGTAVAAEKLDLERITPVPANQPVPVQDFFRPLLFQQPELNDAGTHLAALVALSTGKTSLLVMDLDKPADKPMVITKQGDRDIYHFDWLTNSRLIYSISEERQYGIGQFVVNVGKALGTYPVIERSNMTLVSVPDARQTRPLLHVRWEADTTGDGRKGQVIELNTDLDLSATTDPTLTGGQIRNRNDRHIITTHPSIGGGLETGYLSDKAGELAFGFTTKDGVTSLHAYTDGAWKKCPVNLDDIDVLSFGDKPGELIVRGPYRPDKPRVLQFMDGPTGTLGDVILEDAGYDFYGHLIRDPRTHQLLGLSYDKATPAVYWFSEEYRAVQKIIDGYFPGKIARTWPADETGKNFFIAVYSDREPTTYYRTNLETRVLGLVKSSASWIDPERMRPMSMMKFKSAEGRSLDAYVTLPAGASKEKPVPLVVLPHDGPWTRNTWGYHGTVQFLASRGYAVLQPNYRGSTGTEWMFPYEDRWAFRKMHDDVTAATKAVLKTGLIDRDRIAILGHGSFAGYLAIAGVTFEPDLYRCAVSIGGYYDWEQVIKDTKYDRHNDPGFGLLVRRLGDPKEQAEKFAAIAPARYGERVKAAVLVVHDKEDNVVVIGQAKNLVDSLREHGVTHETLMTSGKGHGIVDLEKAVEVYSRAEKFLEKSLVPRAAPAAK